jgi:putative ABC transport system ATP-binding protein
VAGIEVTTGDVSSVEQQREQEESMRAQAYDASETVSASSAPLIVVRGLTKQYRRGGESVRALAGVDLEIAPGSFIAVMDPSGSGKSTLLNVLTGVDRPSTGEVWLEDRRLDRLSEAQLAILRRERIGLIFQAFNLLNSMSALENVMLPALLAGSSPRAARKRANALLNELGLQAHARALPSQLSGGQQQRVAIARALVNDPVALFADEPTGNLDAHTGQEVLQLLARLRQRGLTIVLVTHDAQVASQAQRIVVMRDGRIIDETAGHVGAPTGADQLFVDLSGLDVDAR